MENYLLKGGLQIFSRPFFDKMYISCFDFVKNTIENEKLHFLKKMCEIENVR